MAETVTRVAVEKGSYRETNFYWTTIETNKGNYYLVEYSTLVEALKELPFDYINWLTDRTWTNMTHKKRGN
jgi:hypothetical protein